MTAVHLCMMELHGDRQCRTEPMPMIAAPCQEGIGVDASVLIDDIVEFSTDNCRCAHNLGAVVRYILTGDGSLLCDAVIVVAKLLDIVGVGDVTVADTSFLVIHDDIDAESVIAVQPVFVHQQVELVDLTGSPSDAPTQEHIKLHPSASAHLSQARHVEGLADRHHRLWRLRPKRKSLCSCRILRVNQLSHRFLSVKNMLIAKVIISFHFPHQMRNFFRYSGRQNKRDVLAGIPSFVSNHSFSQMMFVVCCSSRF